MLPLGSHDTEICYPNHIKRNMDFEIITSPAQMWRLQASLEEKNDLLRKVVDFANGASNEAPTPTDMARFEAISDWRTNCNMHICWFKRTMRLI